LELIIFNSLLSDNGSDGNKNASLIKYIKIDFFMEKG